VEDPFPDPRRPRRGRDEGDRGRQGRRDRRSGGSSEGSGGKRGGRSGRSDAGDGWSDVTPQGTPQDTPPGGTPPPPSGRPSRRATVPPASRRRSQGLEWLDDGASGGRRRKQPVDPPPFALYTTPPGGTTFPRQAEPISPDIPRPLGTPPGGRVRPPGAPGGPGVPGPGGPGTPDYPSYPTYQGSPGGGPGAPGGPGPVLTPAGGFTFGPPGDHPATDAAPPPGRRARRAAAEPEPEPPPRSRRGGILLTVVALVLVAWSVSCLVDLPQPWVAAAAALSPAITVIAVPIVALGVGRRHPVPAALATLAAALPWVLVASYGAPGPGPTSSQSGLSVRVMTVNANGGRASAERIAGLARDNAVDVVVVTELTSGLAHDLTVAGLNNVVTARQVVLNDAGTDGIGLWTQPNFSDGRTVEGLSRPAVAGVVQTATGKVGIVAAHATGSAITPGSSWRSDLAALPGAVPKADDNRGIIVGDFNATPWSPAFRQLASGRWRDAADVVGRGLRPTWPSWTPLPISPLDHVLVSGGLGVSEVNAAEVPGSAHRALIVTVIVPPKQTGG
jgi:endonuclease/exonuclease/phosphatase (EEP) superfamily protein YafD